jgi:hypothetical protein
VTQKKHTTGFDDSEVFVKARFFFGMLVCFPLEPERKCFFCAELLNKPANLLANNVKTV